MNRAVHLLAILLVLPVTVRAADLQALLIDAVRYANTPEKHAAKLAAREALLEAMPAALEEAMNHIHGDSVMLQVLVMEWVEQLPSEAVVPVMLERLQDPNERSRRLAAFFLGFHDVPEHAGAVMPLLADEKCRGAAMRTLGKWRITNAVPDIAAWLAEGKERVRVVAANALRDIGDTAAIPALAGALDDPVFTVRNTAARALVSFGDATVAALDPDAPDLSPLARAMRRRCLSDLEAGPVPLPDGVVLDGAFFNP